MVKKQKVIKLRAIDEVIDCLDRDPADTNKAFNLLLDVFENINLHWKEAYENITLGGNSTNKIEKYIKAKIMNNPPESLQEIKENEEINEDVDTEIINLARIIQVANRSAHIYIKTAKKILRNKGINLNTAKIKCIYSPITERGKNWAFRNIDEFTMKKIIELQKSGIDNNIIDLVLGNARLFEIKHIAIDKLLDKMQEIENPQEKYSYGYTIDERRSVYNKDVFVFDIPGYGQLSAHMINKKRIQELPKYKYPIYEKRNILFFKGLNENAKEFLELNEHETTKEEVIRILKRSELGDSITHHLSVVLMGKGEKVRLSSSDLQDIEKSLNDKRKIIEL